MSREERGGVAVDIYIYREIERKGEEGLGFEANTCRYELL